jgi:DNA polymerase theta
MSIIVALQVHDELLFEVKSSVLQQACSLIKSCMENAVTLSVPFPVKLRVGPSWGELQPYHVQL